MAGQVSTVSAEGQVTIPREIRLHLGLDGEVAVEWLIDRDGEVRLRPMRDSVEAIIGSVPALAGTDPGDFDELIADAMEEAADRVVAAMRRS